MGLCASLIICVYMWAAEFVMRVGVAFLVLLLQGVVGDHRGGARIFDEGECCIMILISL